LVRLCGIMCLVDRTLRFLPEQNAM